VRTTREVVYLYQTITEVKTYLAIHDIISFKLKFDTFRVRWIAFFKHRKRWVV